jgi:hypothetical protein
VKHSRETERVCKGLAAETFVKPFCGVGFIWTNEGMLAKADFQLVIGTTNYARCRRLCTHLSTPYYLHQEENIQLQ